MTSFSKAGFCLGVLLVAASPAFSADESAVQDCDLTQAQGQRRIEAQQRRIEATDVGIIQTTEAAMENIPDVSAGSCSDQIYEMIDLVQSRIQSSIGNIISNVVGSKIASMINQMTCAEAERYYREVMGTKIAEIDDRFGILRSGGQITGYEEGRAVSYDLGDAIELGRKASEAAKSVPTAPPGREVFQPSTATSDATRSAVNGL